MGSLVDSAPGVRIMNKDVQRDRADLTAHAQFVEGANGSAGIIRAEASGILLERADLTGQVIIKYNLGSRRKPSVFTQTPWATHPSF